MDALSGEADSATVREGTYALSSAKALSSFQLEAVPQLSRRWTVVETALVPRSIVVADDSLQTQLIRR